MPSVDMVLCFAPTIDSSARVPSTGSDVRDRCRDFIIKALKKGFNESMSKMRFITLSFHGNMVYIAFFFSLLVCSVLQSTSAVQSKTSINIKAWLISVSLTYTFSHLHTHTHS